jgi:hypothetical protein
MPSGQSSNSALESGSGSGSASSDGSSSDSSSLSWSNHPGSNGNGAGGGSGSASVSDGSGASSGSVNASSDGQSSQPPSGSEPSVSESQPSPSRSEPSASEPSISESQPGGSESQPSVSQSRPSVSESQPSKSESKSESKSKSESESQSASESSGAAPKVEFRARAINYGFDPMVNNQEVGTDVWASVCKNSDSLGRNNVAVKLVIDPPAAASRVTLAVDGEDEACVDVSPKTFSQGETDLTIYGLSVGNPQARIRALAGSQECAVLNVNVLPLRNCKLAIYRVTDSQSSQTSPVTAPTDEAILDIVNDVFRQACVMFTLVDSGSVDVNYDVDPTGGKAQMTELNDHFSYSWGGKIRVALVKASGIPYDSPYQDMMIRGISGNTIGVVFTSNNLQSKIGLVVAHWLGHGLELSVIDSDEGGHDTLPWPSQTGATDGALMKSGSPTGDPLDPVLPQPGKWIRSVDWEAANLSASDFE